MKLNAAQVDRAIGALVGAACGDALGAGYEFGSAHLDGPPRMIGGGLGGFAPGEWTDDTAQTFAIARVAATGADLCTEAALDAIAQGFADWMADGPPDVGIHTSRVLGSVGRHPSSAEMRAVSEAIHARGHNTGGNGTLMRTAPVALAHLDDVNALVGAAIRVATLTHHDPVGGEACALWCLAIRHAVLMGELPDLTALLGWLPAASREFWREKVLDAENQQPGVFNPNGYVVTALQAAWSAIVHTPVPEQDPSSGSFACTHFGSALDTAIAVGHDTDTVAAIAGALLGARWGYSSIPWEWSRLLHGWPQARGEDLHDLAVLAVQRGKPDAQGWPTTARMDYAGHSGYRSFAVHPHDQGVYLSGAAGLDDLPEEVTAVVSLARVGAKQIPERVRHADFRIIDTNAADNPNLAYAIDEAARAVKTLRAEGHVVLLHCVAAQSRTPTVATRYATLLGQPLEAALTDVLSALPEANPNPTMREALQSLCSPKGSG